ncbi:uncharacterized protein LOC125774959 [Anopheles funestus]|uniref:uncharacterized protein LOC125774959 n=1 Tax=Anopheles funestus TaxID=62324 RepID=UPI0020C6B012|nr:uncharacterized protein LOC125774959 [Anopheles funestus]
MRSKQQPRPSYRWINNDKDYQKNYYGKQINVSYMLASPFVYSALTNTKVYGIDIFLLVTFGRRANIQFNPIPTVYHKKEKQKFLKKAKEINSVIWLNRVTWRTVPKSFVTVPDLVQYVIVAPRGQPLTIPEIFLRPLSLASWTLMLIIVVISFLVMWNSGQYFRNDLILLPFCGLERYNLNETKPLEKIIILSLMVFYFLIQSGYESIIISLISDVPFHSDIETLQQLKENQLPVMLYERDNIEFFKPLLEQKNVTVKVIVSDMLNGLQSDAAALHNDRTGINLINYPGFYDVTHNRKKYNILKETFSAHPSGFTFLKRTMLQELFEKHIHNVFEGGFFLHWSYWFQKKPQKGIDVGVENEDSDIVKFGDLAPFWVVIGIGWTLSIFVFILEKFTNLRMAFEMKAPR